MQNVTIQQVNDFKIDFEMYWCGKIQDLVELRRTKLSQSEMAILTGRSIKTIQRFENYESKDSELMFLYNRICHLQDITNGTNELD